MLTSEITYCKTIHFYTHRKREVITDKFYTYKDIEELTKAIDLL